jgi:ABC-type tungstate transport system substrate-binding protein
VQKKRSILKSLALWLFVFACITVAVGFLVYSFSSDEKSSGGFPVLFVLSLCIIGFGILLAFVSFVTGMDELFG